MLQQIFFKSLKVYCQISLWFYFSRWQIQKLAPIPRGPVIFVSNHQNAFLDAVLIICSSFRNPWSLTRAEVFRKPLARKILTLLQMSPVYRFRDGFSTLRKNDSMIETCSNLLARGESILIFGEGNHSYQWYLRSLQKGFARIALAAEEKNNWTLDVQIVPVGIQYESHTHFRSRVLVSFGKPIPARQFMNRESSNQENLDRVIKVCEENLKPLILNIPVEYYEEGVKYLQTHRQRKSDLVEQLASDQATIVEFIHSPKTTPTGTNSARFNPFLFYYAINHFLPRSILRWVLDNKVSDPQFTGSIKFALGMILFPVFQLIQSGVVFWITGSFSIALLYFASLLVSVILKRN